MNPPEFALGVGRLPEMVRENSAEACASDDGFLRVVPTGVRLGVEGITTGSLLMGVPPSPVYVDAWDASMPADVWTLWGWLNFSIAPIGDSGKRLLTAFWAEGTFFDEWGHGVAFALEADQWESWEDDEDDYYEDEEEEARAEKGKERLRLRSEWKIIKKVLTKHFGTAPIARQRWTRRAEKKKRVYDVSYPYEWEYWQTHFAQEGGKG
jgi:hypothetical protein